MISDQILISHLKKSKVFCARENKSEIISALSNPLNLELKQQLVESLDFQYQTDEYVNPDEVTEDELSVDADGGDVNIEEDVQTEDSDDRGTAHTPSHKSSSVSKNTSDIDTDGDSVDDEDKVDDKFEKKDDKLSDEVSESVDVGLDVDEKSVEDLLNTNNSTDGVNYVQIKFQDDTTEIWINYKDNVNINDKISDIMSLISLKYPDWQFNRVARTYNAIIFTCENAQENVVIE